MRIQVTMTTEDRIENYPSNGYRGRPPMGGFVRTVIRARALAGAEPHRHGPRHRYRQSPLYETRHMTVFRI